MLHVVSGDGAAERVTALGVDGEVLVWREALAEGPVMGRPPDAEHLASRASYLAGSIGADVAEIERQLADQVASLDAAVAGGKPIVLWFGRDLFCQLNLLALVAGLDLDAVAGGQLELVLPAEARCMPVELDALRVDYERRRPLEHAAASALAAAFDAFAAGTPAELNRIAASASLPEWARAALELHRRRFPAVGSGLGADERSVLEALADRPQPTRAIVGRFMGANPSLGYGDSQVAALLDRLAALPEPALARDAERFRLTPRGRDALAGRDLREGGNDVPRHLGGVELGPDRRDWRWDPGAAAVV